MTWFHGETSLFSLNRILTAPTKLTRGLWTVFSLIMLASLFYCIAVAVRSYENRFTIFQTNYREIYAGRFPDISVCLNHDQMLTDFLRAIKYKLGKPITEPNLWWYPWNEDASYVTYLVALSNTSDSIAYWADNIDRFSWSSESARSVYHQVFHNFSVEINSSVEMSKIRILEQVPFRNNFLCVTFQVYVKYVKAFDNLRVKVLSPDPKRFQMFIHNENTFNVQYIYDLNPNEQLRVYLNRVLTIRLKQANPKCRNPWDSIVMYGHAYNYTKETCVQKRANAQFSNHCKCIHPDDILKHAQSPCFECQQKASRFYPREVYDACLPLCSLTRLVFDAKTSDWLDSDNGYHAILEIIMANNVQVMKETDIYTITKLLSEIAGLCSLFIGFSLTFVFELFEALFFLFTQKIGLGKKKESKTEQASNLENAG